MEAQASAIFNDLGTPADQRVTPAETRSDEQKLLNAHFPPATPDQFVIRYYTPGQEPATVPREVLQFDQSARAWLSGAEFPPEHRNSLVNAIAKTVQQTAKMSPAQLDTYIDAENAKLDRVFGPTLEEKLRSAAVMIHALDQKTPGLKNLLKSRGIGNSALVVAQIIHQSERWHARRKGR